MHLMLDYLDYFCSGHTSVSGIYIGVEYVGVKYYKPNLYSTDIDSFINTITLYDVSIKNLKDILSSYDMLDLTKTSSYYYRYRKYLPNLNDIDEIFVYACTKIPSYMDNLKLLNSINEKNIDNHFLSILFITLYIILLDNKNKITEWKILLKLINAYNIQQSTNNIILYEYIFKYINAN